MLWTKPDKDDRIAFQLHLRVGSGQAPSVPVGVFFAEFLAIFPLPFATGSAAGLEMGDMPDFVTASMEVSPSGFTAGFATSVMAGLDHRLCN